MNRATSLLPILALLGLGCTQYELVQDDDAIQDLDESGEPDIVLDPDTVAFDEVEVADTSEHVTVVTVANEGDANLHINNIELEDPSAPFSVSAIQSVLVGPGGSTQFEVTFEPETAEDSETYVLIDSNDPDTPTAELLLKGSGVAPVIEVDPEEYDFGQVDVGCEKTLDILVSNVGSSELVVYADEISYQTGSEDLFYDGIADSGDLAFDEDGNVILDVDESMSLAVTYAPMDEYSDIAYLYIPSNDPFITEVQAIQEGTGEIYDTNIDVYDQPLGGLSDIVFALDRSGSMSEDLELVADNFSVFVETLSGMDTDYHVAAVVDDNGCVKGPDIWIDNTFTESEAESAISTMIDIHGHVGSNTERAFMLLEAALSTDNLGSGGCNEGLIRDDATLHLVCVSDEPEQSVNDWSYYVSLFQAMKDDPDDVVIHAVGGDYPEGCGGNQAYEGAYEATVATGGMFLSICATDWASHLESLAEGNTANPQSIFELSETPVEDTITVTVDGEITTVGWEYVADDNSVEFETDYVPEPGATIEIEYVISGNCSA